MAGNGRTDNGKKPLSLHRVTPIPDILPLSGRISSTPSVGSIPEGDEEDYNPVSSQDNRSALTEQKGSNKRLPLVREALDKIDEMSVSQSQSHGFEDLRGYRAPIHQRSRSASPSASETSDASGAAYRNVNLFRTTPIPNEAAGSLSGQSSFSSMKRNGKYSRMAPTISEDEEEEIDSFNPMNSFTALSERQDSMKSTGSLHRPTPIPKDLNSASLGRRSGNVPSTPTIHEDDAGSASGGESESKPTQSRWKAGKGSLPIPTADLPENSSMSDLKRSPPSSFSTAAPQLPRVAEATVAYEAQTPRHQSGNTTTNSTRSIPENHSSRSIPEEDTGKGYNRGTDVTSIKDDGLDTARPNANLTAQNLQERTPQNGERLYDSVSSYSNQPIRQNLTMGTVEEANLQKIQAKAKAGHVKTPSIGQASENYSPHSSTMHAPFVDNRDNERDMLGVARFLRMTPGLSRQLIGELLGENNERCIKVLEIFTGTFDFKGLTFETALREYMEAFRLPGESQKIYRILEAWSRQFYQQCGPGVFNSADATLNLAFSLILLNTDLHNHQVKKKMTQAEFIRNNKGINDTLDFPTEFLTTLYNNVARRGLKQPPPYGHIARNSTTSSLPETARRTQQRYESPKKTRRSSSSFFCFRA